MPTFVSEEIYIEPWEFVDSCSKSEIKSLIDCLIENGHIGDGETIHGDNTKHSFLDEIWYDYCQKLMSIRLRMSNEDEDVIKRIVDKY